MAYLIKANTPAEMREEIVKWLNYNAVIKRSAARTAKLKTTAKEANVAARTYEMAASFIENIDIQHKD